MKYYDLSGLIKKLKIVLIIIKSVIIMYYHYKYVYVCNVIR